MMPTLTPREVAHDLRQPLATIRALAEVARTRLADPDEVLRCLARIDEQVRDMGELCHRLVAAPDGVAPFRVDHVARRVAADAEVAYGGRVDVVSEPAVVEGDKAGLRRALWNLLENACRAAGASGPVRVEVAQAEDEVTVAVDDGGPGFGRGPRGTASIGLCTAQWVAEAHGGRLEISDSDLGGARVALALPAWAPAPPSPEEGERHLRQAATR